MSTRLSTEGLAKLKRSYFGMPPDADAKVLVAEIEASWAESAAARRTLRDLTAAVKVENRGMGRTTLHISQDDLRSVCDAARAVLSENPVIANGD